jgi:hypothetical protein
MSSVSLCRSSPTSSALVATSTKRAKPGSLRQRDLARFLRQQQGVGGCKSADNDPGRLRPKLSECWLDRLPVTAVHRVATRATGGKILTKTTFIQRLNTTGGSAPIPAARSPAMWGIKRSCRTLLTISSSARGTRQFIPRPAIIQDVHVEAHKRWCAPCARSPESQPESVPGASHCGITHQGLIQLRMKPLPT